MLFNRTTTFYMEETMVTKVLAIVNDNRNTIFDETPDTVCCGWDTIDAWKIEVKLGSKKIANIVTEINKFADIEQIEQGLVIKERKKKWYERWFGKD